MFVHPKSCNHPTPLSLPLLYFGFHPWNLWKMIENVMKVFCNIINISPLYDSLCNFTCTTTSGSIPTCGYAILTCISISIILTCISIFIVPTSSSTNSICGFISKGCILDTSFYIVGIISTYPCSWVLCGSFSSWPPPLRSYGFFVYTFTSWIAPLLKSCGFLSAIPPPKLFH